jgi:hypothetical protein
MAFVQAGPAAGPLVREIEFPVQEREASAPVVADEDADLAVFRFPEPPAPLTGDPDGVSPFLGKGAAIEGEDAVGISDPLGHLAVKFGSHGIVLPLSRADESLEWPPGLKVRGGDGLDRLSVQVAEKSFEVLPGVVTLLSAVEEWREGLGEPGHPPERPFDLLRLNPSGTEQLLRNDRKGQTHKPPSLAYLEGLSADSGKTLRGKSSQ